MMDDPVLEHTYKTGCRGDRSGESHGTPVGIQTLKHQNAAAWDRCNVDGALWRAEAINAQGLKHNGKEWGRCTAGARERPMGRHGGSVEWGLALGDDPVKYAHASNYTKPLAEIVLKIVGII
jgi:hypothetical protein